MRKFVLALVSAGLLVIALSATATATKPNPDHKVNICHRTASDSNPYVFISVDEAAELAAHLSNGPGHPAKTNPDGSPRNDYLATSRADCSKFVVITPPADEPPTETTVPNTAMEEPNLLDILTKLGYASLAAAFIALMVVLLRTARR